MPLYGVSHDGPHLCIVYPFMSGSSLAAAIVEKRKVRQVEGMVLEEDCENYFSGVCCLSHAPLWSPVLCVSSAVYHCRARDPTCNMSAMVVVPSTLPFSSFGALHFTSLPPSLSPSLLLPFLLQTLVPIVRMTILRDVASALDYLHTKGKTPLVHRDVKRCVQHITLAADT